MRTFILAFALVAPVLTILLWSTSPVAALGVLMLSHALLLYPTLVPNVQWLGPVITAFEPSGRQVWLTIDDGPTEDTPVLLDLLEARGVKATFFVKGSLAEQHQDLVHEIVRRGHSVANHSYSHPSASFWCLHPAAIRREIERCNAILSHILGDAPRWFRAPVGMKNPAVHPVLSAHAMQLIGWTTRGFDTTTRDGAVVLRRLLGDVAPGAIVVLHQGRSWSASVMEHVIDGLQARGYSFVVPEPGRLKTNR